MELFRGPYPHVSRCNASLPSAEYRGVWLPPFLGFGGALLPLLWDLFISIGKLLVKTRDPAPTQADLRRAKPQGRCPAGTPGPVLNAATPIRCRSEAP